MINFNIEVPNLKLNDRIKKKKWLKSIAESEKFKIVEANYIFLDDEGLLKINQEYLNHDTYTDIITFDNSEKKGAIETDIFLSVDRIKENATLFKVTFDEELHRVMAHGILHLCGYKDKSKEEKVVMRSKEDFYTQQYDKFYYRFQSTVNL